MSNFVEDPMVSQDFTLKIPNYESYLELNNMVTELKITGIGAKLNIDIKSNSPKKLTSFN